MREKLAFFLSLLVFVSCSDDKDGTSDPICNCYRFEHKKINVDYDQKLADGLGVLQQLSPELSDIDLENYQLLITHLQENPDQDLSKFDFPDMEEEGLNYSLLKFCVKDQLKRNTNVKDRVEEMDEIAIYYSYTNSIEQWNEYLEDLKKSLDRISGMDAWMKPFLLRGMLDLIEQKKEVDVYRDEASEVEELLKELEEVYDEIPMPEPPPPPPAPPIEIEVEEDDIEEVEVVDWQ